MCRRSMYYWVMTRCDTAKTRESPARLDENMPTWENVGKSSVGTSNNGGPRRISYFDALRCRSAVLV